MTAGGCLEVMAVKEAEFSIQDPLRSFKQISLVILLGLVAQAVVSEIGIGGATKVIQELEEVGVEFSVRTHCILKILKYKGT